MEPTIMIKYGEKQHLEQLVGGTIRFAPTEDYISMQRKNGTKGQGDSDEGKMHIKSIRSILQPHDEKTSASIISNADYCLSFEDRKPRT